MLEDTCYIILYKYRNTTRMKYYGTFRTFEETERRMKKLVRDLEEQYHVSFDCYSGAYCLNNNQDNSNIPIVINMQAITTQVEFPPNIT